MRIKGGSTSNARKKKILRLTKGYRGSRSTLIRRATEASMRAGRNAYIGRKLKKRDFRRLWIARINAAVRELGMTYSTFMHALKVANIDLDRKVLAELCVNDKDEFAKIVELAKKAA